ncbi:hypothetical protein [Paracoccus aerius]|uniref:hypothetical protein n=1 Tax=Paracoccus aerius TaxID=1915382 RepID=UPI00174AD379|nr:hypothetical protein [Paracoccus aerius]
MSPHYKGGAMVSRGVASLAGVIIARRYSFNRPGWRLAQRKEDCSRIRQLWMPETCLSILISATYSAKIRRASTANKELTDGQRHEQAKT